MEDWKVFLLQAIRRDGQGEKARGTRKKREEENRNPT